jgi:XRE family aerobic/anaerobic benzoate catabolism transcriptional regulator
LRRVGVLAALGHAVRILRQERGLSQQALAARAGLSPRFVTQLEAGEGNISVAKLAELARALDVPLAALLAADDAAAGGEDEAAALRGRIALALHGRPTEELRALLDTLRTPRAEGSSSAPALIALVGLRGAGKSTLGPLLAGALGRPFVELDQEVQELTGLATSEIFELHGEDYYREAERHALQRLIARGEPAVLAASGGAVADAELFRLLKERTLLVWVKADPEQHMQRVLSQGDRRPMADRPDAMAELRHLLRARAPYYEQARLVADTSAASPQACVGRLVAQLERLGAGQTYSAADERG